MIFNIQKCSIHDGHGLRTLVFFKGCPLRCPWCANPESQDYGIQIMEYPSKCIGCGLCARCCPYGAIGPDGRIDRSLCPRECQRCSQTCYAEAKKTVGRDYTIDELFKEINKDKIFYDIKGGGVTFSGGEPLTHGAYLKEIARKCRENRINVCVESCGYAPFASFKDALEYIDSMFMHIKDREAELGKHINDVLHTCGTRFTSIKKPHSYLKVNDVIKYGKPVIDWEVEVTSDKSPGECMIASNDMYPLFDTRNEVSGVAEISRSRNTKINQVRDTLGLVADYTFEDILGNSRPMQDVKKLAMSFAISPYNVLIYGESGTGKELFAQSIHNYSTRRNKPFVAINCASISPELIDSELFGYESGAFTGASKNGHVGKIELSNEGTLFLDEVAELPLHAQTRLLRTLETGQITRLGGSRNISVDVRVIAATNRSLEKMIEEGLFREDLYYRLMVLNITIPPLRERPEDIIPCCEFFLRQAMRTNTAGKKTIEKNAMKLLLGYDWPGNVRELRNIINRVYVMSSSSVISRESLIAAFQFNNPHYSGLTAEMTPAEMLCEKQLEISRSYASLLKEALLLASGNKAEAAKLMGVSRKTIYNMLEKYKEYLK